MRFTGAAERLIAFAMAVRTASCAGVTYGHTGMPPQSPIANTYSAFASSRLSRAEGTLSGRMCPGRLGSSTHSPL